ncbi:hypothetical protein [Edaphobacter dinghuensis]|uniref:Uncharacterized protein n=1 Tax=Edaphobacter dinghuensis TaxID=1560005 RepID=A0A917H9H8_9BACT|nr:hypothetical protein [Edaphobacter dinghuensis]GGG71960.1 hypothetical protein GCM10011585_12790 [Edaphobacter dinghuensis]
MNDQERLRQLVMGSARQAANHPSVGTAVNLQGRAEDIDPMRYFTTQDYNGRVLPQEKYKPVKPLPPVGVFGKLFR